MEIKKISIKNKMDQLEDVQQFLEQLGMEWQLDARMIFEINLVLEEYITNLVNYGYHDRENHDIIIEILKEETQLKIIIIDDAGPFNILETPDNEDVEKPVGERRIGGLGIHFIKKLTDQLEYQSVGGMNRLEMVKKLH